jgi:hypothetical protein
MGFSRALEDPIEHTSQLSGVHAWQYRDFIFPDFLQASLLLRQRRVTVALDVGKHESFFEDGILKGRNNFFKKCSCP